MAPARNRYAARQHYEDALTRFRDEHEQAFAFRDDERAVEIYAARVAAIGKTPKPQTTAGNQGGDKSTAPPETDIKRPVYFPGDGYIDSPVYRRESLTSGMKITGPAVIEQLDSTVVLTPGSDSEVTDDLHIVTRIKGA